MSHALIIQFVSLLFSVDESDLIKTTDELYSKFSRMASGKL